MPRAATTLLAASLIPLALASCAGGHAPAQVHVPAHAQTQDERVVLEVAQRLFDAMAARDAARAAEVLLPQGQWVSLRPGEGGQQVAVAMSYTDFLTQLGAGDEPWLERMWDARVEVNGPIAVIWMRYDFHHDGRFSHCGDQTFTLVRLGGAWRIAGGTYTVEPTACPPSPLGPPR